LPRGGHDYRKLYAAYKAATEEIGAPTAILGRPSKLDARARDRSAQCHHQIKKMTKDQLRVLRDRLHLHEEIPDEALDAEAPPYYRPPAGSPVHEYLTARGRALGGHLPNRVVRGRGLLGLPAPEPATFAEFALGSRGQPVSTDHGVREAAAQLAPDPASASTSSPSCPTKAARSARRALRGGEDLRPGGSALQGRRCRPASLVLRGSLRPDPGGGHHGGWCDGELPGGRDLVRDVVHAMLPIYLFYSMFGFQRVGDLIWQAADARARGFLMGLHAGGRP